MIVQDLAARIEQLMEGKKPMPIATANLAKGPRPSAELYESLHIAEDHTLDEALLECIKNCNVRNISIAHGQ
jgi:hypothetical protein